MNSEEILKFWFEELTSKQWWVKDQSLDNLIKERFLHYHKAAVSGELFNWRKTAKGRLAEIIIIDQFSRNIFRNQKESFLFDGIALVLSQEAVSIGADTELDYPEVSFLYLPYMHSESALIHEKAVELYSSREELSFNLEFEFKHKKIIDRFGRYPHRNEILGRESTPEEIEFLQGPDSSF